MQKPLLIMLLGSPGAGKSYFARHLVQRIRAVRLNGDSMRIALFGSVEGIEQQPDRILMNKQTFGAIDYAAEQILLAGCSVVYDANNNKRSIRAGLEKLAAKCGAVPVVVWIKTPYEVAVLRGQERTATPDQRRFSEAKMKQTIAAQMAVFDEPVVSENVIEIDGLADFERQHEAYTAQLGTILGTAA